MSKKNLTGHIPYFYIAAAALSLVLSIGIILAVIFLNPIPVSSVYGTNAAWNKSTELKTGENLEIGVNDREGYLTVPVPEGTSEDDIEVDSDYIEHVTRIMISGVPENFFRENVFSGDLKNIDRFRYGFEGETAVLELHSARFYETKLELKTDKLYVGLIPPHEKYDRIVVVDASHGGEETGSVSYGVSEKDITLNVSSALEKAAEGLDYHIYFTRNTDTAVSGEARQALVEDTQADLVLGLHTDADPDTRVTHGISTYYYEDKDREFAEKLGKLVADSTISDFRKASLRRGGSIAENTGSGAVDLCLGYITNKRDALTATSDKFAQRAAEGVIEALNGYFADEGKEE